MESNIQLMLLSDKDHRMAFKINIVRSHGLLLKYKNRSQKGPWPHAFVTYLAPSVSFIPKMLVFNNMAWFLNISNVFFNHSLLEYQVENKALMARGLFTNNHPFKFGYGQIITPQSFTVYVITCPWRSGSVLQCVLEAFCLMITIIKPEWHLFSLWFSA